MRGEVPYEAIEYGGGDGSEIVALVAGFGSKPGELDNAGRSLARSGRDAVVYTYHPRILLAGEANLLPEFIDDVNDDFSERAKDYDRRRFCGASLGGAIAANMQKRYYHPERGLYGATGGCAAEIVMHNRWFGAICLAVHGTNVSQAFRKNGYTTRDLQEIWQDTQELPPGELTLALGRLDLIMNHHDITSRMAKLDGPRRSQIEVVTRPLSGHTGTIKWFDQHIVDMIETKGNSDE